MSIFCSLFKRNGEKWMSGEKEKQKNSHFDGREWFRREVEQRAYAVLKSKNKQFAIDHENDTRAQLADYLKECAEQLEHSPSMYEVIGGEYIAWRFDGWNHAMAEAGLRSPRYVPDKKKTKLFMDEYKNQERLFGGELQKRKAQRNNEKQLRKEAREEEKEARLILEKSWEEEHRTDTDEQLISYVQQCAEELGFTPYRKHVLGSSYITERFGGWYDTLTLAKLPIPEDMKKPSRRKKKQKGNGKKS